MQDIVIVSAVRSALCRAKKGQFAHTRPEELLAEVMREVLARLPQMDAHDIGDVLIGCATQEGEQGLNVARQAALLAGLPTAVPAVTLSRYGASSSSAVMFGAAMVQTGRYPIALAGGVESASRVPLGGYNPSPPPRLLEANPEALTPPGVAAENLARKYNISREEQDAFAVESHKKALAAWTEGRFAAEVVPVATAGKEGRSVVVGRDDAVREPNPKELADLPPIFMQGGSVTAGNSAPLADGAAVAVLMSAAKAQAMGVSPLAYLRGHAVIGCPGDVMGLGAALAAERALASAGLTLAQMDVIELSEQFAAAAIACLKALHVEPDSRVNVNGGALALGHPFGANGVRMLTTAAHALAEKKGRYALVAIGTIGGQGEALILERAA